MRSPSRLGSVRSLLAQPPAQVVVLLLFLAAVPAFTAAPGAMPADSKLYLYLNPGRLISDAFWSFDQRQFAGWVPHQHITFLWPSGPWFWVADVLGFPDWVAHRSWITGLFLAAGLGVVWTSRLLGLTWAGATIAAVIYQLSPYTLAYVSRTSVMLLPWAGLGWILALTVMSARSGGTGPSSALRWRYPALLALVVLTVGSVNPTAIVMIAPAPVLWLIHTVVTRALTLRQAAAVVARITVLSVGVSAWWMAMVMTQRRHGAEVLGFSETLEDVSATATATEVVRGLGYWLFYVRDAFGPATSASAQYVTSVAGLLVSFVVVVTGLWAIASTRWAHRSFAAALILFGTILAVGVYPIDDPAPLMGLLADTEVALALRSSTRAVPMLLLGLALMIGARLPLLGAGAVQARGVWGRLLGVAPVVVVTVICVVNLPAWWGGGFVDPGLRRESDPPKAWTDAAAAIDARAEGYRILQLPGAEFGSYRWGHTVDQPLVALTDRPLITRDLLPLGSPVAMDLLFSLDDRIQRGVMPAGAISVVSRLFGADLVWLTNDLAHERYRTVRPATLLPVLEADAGLQMWETFGERQVFGSDRERIDPISLSDPAVGVALPPVMVWEVADAVPVVRAQSAAVVIGGSGDGIIDAAGAGLIDGHELILYAAASSPEQIAAAQRLIITDSARARARQWRSSQDVIGATESVDPNLLGLDPMAGDQRLGISGGPFVTAEQVGPVRATASSYGERFAFLPEMRPVMAIDGDPTTAWRVAGQGDPVGERLRLYFDETVDHLQLLQPEAGRHITSVRIEATDPETRELEVVLGSASLEAPGQRVDLAALWSGAAPGGPTQVDIVITGVSAGPADPVGFAEVGPFGTLEYLQIPDYGHHPNTSFLFTRDRIDPRTMWRSDPEPQLNRRFTSNGTSNGTSNDGESWRMDLRISIDQRASDAVLARWMETAAIAESRLQGVVAARGHSAVDGDRSTAWISDFTPAGWRKPGPVLEIIGLEGSTDRIQIIQPEGDFSEITEIEIAGSFVTGVTGTAAPIRVPVNRADGTGGRSAEIILPTPIGPGPLQIRVTAVDPRLVRDLRTGQMMTAPVAITEIDFKVPVRTTVAPILPECIADLIWFGERSIPVRIDSLTGRAVPCDQGLVWLDDGSHLLRSTASDVAPGLKVDQVLLSPMETEISTIASGSSARGSLNLSLLDQTRLGRSVEITNCVPSCWVVLGEGHNPAWRAEVEGRPLGPPVVVDGGFNGWFILPDDPDGGPVRVEMRWAAQTPLTVAFGISGLFIAGCGWLGRPRRLWGQRMRDELRAGPVLAGPVRAQTPERHRITASDWRIGAGPHTRVGRLASIVLWVAAAVVFVGPLWGLVAAVLAVPGLMGLRVRIAELVALLGLVLSVIIVMGLQLRRSPVANMAWPEAVGEPHRIALFAVVSLITVAVFADDRRVREA